MTESADTALGHVRVLELGGPLAAFAGHYLAELGADVIKIEPPDGSPERWDAPFYHDAPGPESSLPFIYFNANKRSVILDLDIRQDRSTLVGLAAGVDIILESYAPGYLDSLGIGYKKLKRANPGLVMVSLSPYGQWGPYSGFRGNAATAEGMSGMIFTLGDDQRSPCLSPNSLLYQVAGMDGAYAALTALYNRRHGGSGQQVDISAQEVGTHITAGVSEYGARQNIRRRTGAGSLGGATNIYELEGGPVHFMPGYAPHWRILVDWIADPLLLGPEWNSMDYRQANADVVSSIVTEFVSRFPRADLIAEAQRQGIACGPVNSVREAVESPQFEALGSWQERTHPVIGGYKSMRLMNMTGTPQRFIRPAPAPGEHTSEVLEGLKKHPRLGNTETVSHPRRKTPLEGLRILDFTRVVAGPTGTQLLSYLGADVIKIESQLLPSLGRETGMAFPDLNRAKRSITVDTRTPGGRDIALRLAAQSDVVIDNFSPHIMKRLGLDYAELCKVKPDIIMASMPGMGRTGPLNEWGTFGQTLQSYTGLVDLWRHPETTLTAGLKTPIADYVCGEQLALGVMAAIEYRDRTGRGQFIDLVQVEGLSHTMGALYMDYMMNGRDPKPEGYQSDRYAPFNAYPCLGYDSWCVIAVETDAEWVAFRKVIGQPGWALEERFATRISRIEHRSELDRRIADWTREFTAKQVMYFMQRAGVTAGAIQNAEDIHHDVHLRARGHLVEVHHPAPYGTFQQQGLPFLFSHTPGDASLPCPREGEHNDDVFRGLLGLAPETIQQLCQERVIV